MSLGLSIHDVTIDDISSFFKSDAEIHVLRLDKISNIISGNKWFKLRYYLDAAKAMHKKGIITFGGAWSNHIIATAAACFHSNLQSIGIIRGEEPKIPSYTLNEARKYGMQLNFISRAGYQRKTIPANTGNDFLVVNEGGYGELGAMGAATILDLCENLYTNYVCAIGTGTMLAGIVNRLSAWQQATGISVLKQNWALPGQVRSLLTDPANNRWNIIHDYCFGGYAKHHPDLLKFMNDFYRQTGIPSDFVYTGKLFYGIARLLEKKYFAAGSKILLIHSGGLQGNASLPQGTLMF